MTSSCPICWEELSLINDCARTSCGHEFHLSCLSHHLFKTNHDCPCCRTELIRPEWAADSTDYSETDSEETESESEHNSLSHESTIDLHEYHPVTDETLRAVRFLFNTVDRDQIDYREDTNSTDLEEEAEYLRITQIPDAPPVFQPTFETIVNHLQSLSFTFIDVVQALFVNYYYDGAPDLYEQYMINQRIYGQMEHLLTQYVRRRR